VPQSHYLHANGLRLHYLDSGGGGRPLVLVPGLTANAHSFAGLFAAGLADSRRVLVFDARGRGLSDKPESGYGMADHTADLLGALDALGLERVHLGGHSFGGLLTYYVAANHPERVETAIVLDAPADLDPAILDQIAPSLARLERTFGSWDEYDDLVRSFPYWDGFTWNDELHAYYRGDAEERPDGSIRPRCNPAHIRAVIEGELEVDWPATIERITCPTLLVRATDRFGPPGSGPILTADSADRALARLRDGSVVEIRGNHITFIFGSNARDVVEAIASFIARQTS
jgi:pimeloyl-ACP methyl ester carboxylesterase